MNECQGGVGKTRVQSKKMGPGRWVRVDVGKDKGLRERAGQVPASRERSHAGTRAGTTTSQSDEVLERRESMEMKYELVRTSHSARGDDKSHNRDHDEEGSAEQATQKQRSLATCEQSDGMK